MKDLKVAKAKELNWINLPEIISPLGWELTKNKSGFKVFERNNEKIAASKFGKKWKVEYFVDKRLKDSAGFSEEWLSRVIVMIMAVIHSMPKSNS